jgi:hypothetical protein
MDSAIALPAALEGVNLTDIALAFVFLTVPGIALERGLKQFRTAPAETPFGDGQANGRLRRRASRLTSQLASFITIVAMLAAGLGLVPLAEAIYKPLSGLNKWAPALVGVAVLSLVAIKGFVMYRALKNGEPIAGNKGKKGDQPWVWLAPVPLLTMLWWTAPMVWDQMTNQAGQTVQMIFGKHPADGQGHHDEGSDSKKEHKRPSHTGHNTDH